ncbi:hypothetical protein Bca101_032085 [Brassica carinata]
MIGFRNRSRVSAIYVVHVMQRYLASHFNSKLFSSREDFIKSSRMSFSAVSVIQAVRHS